jgi:hypothetical protein
VIQQAAHKKHAKQKKNAAVTAEKNVSPVGVAPARRHCFVGTQWTAAQILICAAHAAKKRSI